MRIFRAFGNVQQPLFEGADTGSGGGGGGSQGAGGGQGGGVFQPSSANPHNTGNASQGASAPVAYSDDMQITRDGKTMTMKEYISSSFVPKADYDNVRNLTRQEIEANLRKLAATMQQGQRQQPHQQQRPDPLAGVRDAPILSGQQLEQALSGTLGPLAQSIAQMQQQNHQLAATVKKLQGGVGTLAKERSGQERTTRISQALSSLGEGYDVKDPFLNEIAQDVLDAWEFEKPEEFPAMVQQRINAAEKFFRARDKQRLEAAKKTRFVRPGGSAAPSGNPRMDPRTSASQVADALFGARTNAHAT